MCLVCNNRATLHIVSNLVFHERTNNIEVDCYFIIENWSLETSPLDLSTLLKQLADIFTKSLRGLSIDYICCKLGTCDLYAPTMSVKIIK